jgi:predicted DCC family thiol-disulfide oxidoreductase YuxK
VQFIIRHDHKGLFKFASLQSNVGQQLLRQLNLSTTHWHSIILIDGDKAYQQSDAALLIAKKLSGLWPLLFSFSVVPRFIRNAVYNWIAKNRYRLFGKKKECWIPTPQLKSRFID